MNEFTIVRSRKDKSMSFIYCSGKKTMIADRESECEALYSLGYVDGRDDISICDLTTMPEDPCKK